MFGAAHFHLLWEGDILFSYAVAALMLMVVLYGKTRPLLIAIAAVAGLGFIPGLSDIFAVAGGLAAAGLIALYLRSETRVNIRGRGIPLFSFLLLLIGALLIIAAAVFWLLPDGPVEPRLPLSVFGPLLRSRDGSRGNTTSRRKSAAFAWRSASTCSSPSRLPRADILQRFAPDPDAGVTVTAAALAEAHKKAEDKKAEDKKVEEKKVEDKDRKQTKEERAAERQAERENQLAEGKADREKELRIFTSGSYWETVKWSGGRFPEKAASDFGFAIILIGMFLLGILVRALGCDGQYRRASAALSQAGRVWACLLASGSDCLAA